MPKLIDLTKKQFKNYLVKEKAQSKNGKVYWLCECQICHKQKEIQGTHLKNGTFANCCEQNQSFLENNNSSIIKKCLICGQPFIPKTKGKTRKYCYKCSPAKNDRSAAITAIRHAIKHQLIIYKGGKCEKCGYDKCEGALQFHHINPDEKDFELALMYNNGHNDMKILYQEVDKCALLCANCHAEEHYK